MKKYVKLLAEMHVLIERMAAECEQLWRDNSEYESLCEDYRELEAECRELRAQLRDRND